MRLCRYLPLLLALLLGLPPAHAQLIDTIEDPDITANDSVNRKIGILDGFRVSLIKPELVSGSGVTVKNGFDTYYIHVVKVTEAYVEGQLVTATDSQETYYAVSSKLRRLRIKGDSLNSKALFLKGIVYGQGARDQQAVYDSLAKRYRLLADSMDQVMKTAFMPERWLVERAGVLRQMARNCDIAAEAYEEFRSAGRTGSDVAGFILKHYLNQSDRFNVYTHPYGLPQVTEADELDKKGNVVDPGGPAQHQPARRRSWFRRMWDKLF